MATSGENGQGARNTPKPDDYLQWKVLPAGGRLNRWSHNLTNKHDLPGARAMLYGAGVPSDMMDTAPHVGIATVWWEGNPCKYVPTVGISKLCVVVTDAVPACTVRGPHRRVNDGHLTVGSAGVGPAGQGGRAEAKDACVAVQHGRRVGRHHHGGRR